MFGDHHQLTVMTQNVYVGANLDVVIAALANSDPADDLPALLGAIQTLLETDFPSRAVGLAREIAAARPLVIGLQEISTIAIDLRPGLPVVINQDFLAILQSALTARGLQYDVAATQKNFTVSPVPGISLSDYDVLLVDADRVHVSAGEGHAFSVNLGTVAPGVEIKRGWVTARARVMGQEYVFASTHPESGQGVLFEQLRAAQLSELLSSLPGGVPVVLMGDLNDYEGTPMYQLVTAAGFLDLWRGLYSRRPGNTCCHADNLSNLVARFDQRIDYVFLRGFGQHPPWLNGTLERIGDRPVDRVPGPAHPLWPSDHAGLVATLTR
jgi:hypothetical protein